VVGWEFLGEGLEEVPGRFGSVDRSQGCLIAILTRVCTEQERGVLFGDRRGVVQDLNFACDEVIRDVLERVVAQAHLHGLVEEQHVDLVVPRVLAQVGRVGV
jgi:hypothetical protein